MYSDYTRKANYGGAIMPELIQNIIKELDSLLQPALFTEDMSINGVQVEGRKKNVERVATAVTASEYVIQRAISLHADLLLVHHGLFLKGITPVLVGSLSRKVEALLHNGITLIGHHLPIDSHPHYGNAFSLPLEMGWGNINSFGTYNKGSITIGVTATLPHPMTARELANKLSSYWGSSIPSSFVALPEKVVEKIAFIPGHGHKWIHDAVKVGADCFITGTFDEPLWHIAKEEGIAFMPFGHHATEKAGVRRVGDYLATKFTLHHSFIDEDNPY